MPYFDTLIGCPEATENNRIMEKLELTTKRFGDRCESGLLQKMDRG